MTSFYDDAVGYALLIFQERTFWQGYKLTEPLIAQAHDTIAVLRETFVDRSEGRPIPMEIALTSTTIVSTPEVSDADQALFGNLMGGFAEAAVEGKHEIAGGMAGAIAILTDQRYFTVRARDMQTGLRTSFEGQNDLFRAMVLFGEKDPVQAFVDLCNNDPAVLTMKQKLRAAATAGLGKVPN